MQASSEVETYLNGIGLRNDSNQIGKHQYYVSDLPAKFKTIAERFLGTELDHIEKIDIDQLIIHLLDIIVIPFQMNFANSY